MKYSVHQIAKMANISVRTLHFYDEVGLLKPSSQATNGYRSYEEKELAKLQQILFFKELEFPLKEIKKILDNPGYDSLVALKDQKKLFEIKKERLENLLKTIDQTIINLKGKNKMADKDLFNGLDDKKMEEYQKEAKERWGQTKAYKQSQERTKNWTKEDYQKIKEDGLRFTKELGNLMDKSVESPEVQEMVAKHKAGIEVFYDCSLEMYKNLGEMYVQDPRFTAYYDKVKPGLAVFLRDAIAYYVESHK